MQAWKIDLLLVGAVLSLLVTGCTSPAIHVQPSRVFPGKHWQQKTPAEVGLDPMRLEAFARYISEGRGQEAQRPSRGCIIKDGYMVYSWGDPSHPSGWFSASKPVLSTLLFFAIEDGKLSSVDAWVADLGWPLVAKDQSMTFRHLANMTSGYACNEAPGQAWAYNDYAIMFYALSLEKAMGRSIKQAADKYFSALRFEDGDLIGNHLRGRGVSASCRDFARVGWFWMNRGGWGGRQVLPQAYFDAYMKPQVPADLPRTATVEPNDYLKIGSYGGGHDQVPYGPGMYGFNWWYNAPGPDGRQPAPDGPADMVMAVGYGGNVMVMLPSQGLLVAARANWGGLRSRQSDARLNTALRMLMSALSPGTDAGR